ncbi:hypothetical protein [Pontibacter ramchanderi]|uniref:hypothetical protein n=1 Tax=Pontibacter ramchanderi TaxID=1179743 RepID=UPI00117CD2BC|nr:hypothetical protein [Pontibacter ramchanderi]
MAGLLLFSLTHSSRQVSGQILCLKAHSDLEGKCHVAGYTYDTNQSDVPAELATLQEPATEQVTLTGRMLQLLDTFARLVMVI